MLTKKVRLRILYLILSIIALTIVVFIIIKSLEENIVYFFSPTEIYNKENVSFNQKIRVGGLVKRGSLIKKGNSVNFIITDFKNELIVNFTGSVPNLFEEGKGVVAEGFIQDKNYFKATKILAKHDENYMPPEVKESLKDTN